MLSDWILGFREHRVRKIEKGFLLNCFMFCLVGRLVPVSQNGLTKCYKLFFDWFALLME